MGRVTARRKVVHLDLSPDAAAAGTSVRRRPDTLVVEEPLEIRVGGRSLAVTMRTPGHDMELAAGFLAGEGVIGARDDVVSMRYCAGTDDNGEQTYNLLDVELAEHVPAPDASVERSFYTTSSCGLCGKASIDAVRILGRHDLRADVTVIDPALLVTLPDRLRDAQTVFERTGGLHAAGLFDAVTGDLLVVREDVGRHNAVDKVVGWALQDGRLPLRGTVLMVSGRASFELVQKAVVAGVPALSAVSAPSSLAVDLAEESGLTLVGFLRGQSMNVYSTPERVLLPGAPAGASAQTNPVPQLTT
jgi:FdhD protein